MGGLPIYVVMLQRSPKKGTRPTTTTTTTTHSLHLISSNPSDVVASERIERAASYNRIYLPVYPSVVFPGLWEVSYNWASCYRIHLTATIGFIFLYATFLEGGTRQPLTTQGRMQDSGTKTAQASCPEPYRSFVFLLLWVACIYLYTEIVFLDSCRSAKVLSQVLMWQLLPS